MPLDPEDREYVVSSVVDILRHRKREKLLEILRERLEHSDYDDAVEKDLDQVVLALARAIDEQLTPKNH